MKRILVSALMCFCLVTTLRAATRVDPSLLLWLPLDEGDGSFAADRSPNGLEAELSGIRWATGTFGTAAFFGGTNTFIDLPPVPGLNGATQFTFSAWVTWEESSRRRYPNLLTSQTWSPGGLMLFVSDDTCSFRLGRPGQHAGRPGNIWTETSVPVLTALPQHQWVHLCVTFSRPQVTTYVNGKLVARGSWPYAVEADALCLGRWNTPVCHKGLIDDVRIYARAFTDSEVATLSNDPTRASTAYALVDGSKREQIPAATFENRHVTLTLDAQGSMTSLRTKKSRRELLARPQPMVSARLKDGRTLAARTVVRSRNTLNFGFPRGLGSAVISVDAQRDLFTFTLESLTLSNVSSLVFCQVPVITTKYLGGMANMLSDDADAVCLRGYELPVEMGTEGNVLRVWATAERGLSGWRAGLAAGSKAEMPAMLRAMAHCAGVPTSRLGGPWSLGAEANRGSYLFADLKHASTDDWIELARRGGFSTVHLHAWWRSLGHYEVNTNLYPRGLVDMKDTVSRIHDAGLRAGIHTLTACIEPHDPWITPEASPYLIPFDSYTLARTFSPTDTVLYVTEPPSPRHDVVFTYMSNGNAIRIDSEIVQYAEVAREPPYAFARCTRGAFKTRPAAHAAGERADYLQQRYISFYPLPDSPLAADLADHIAHVFNTCGLDQIYFDGSEGMRSRYGIDAMRHTIFKRLAGDPLVEASCHGEHNWWFHSRLGAWDHPVWAAKRFHDKHIATSSRYRDSDLLEPQMGWWAPRMPTAQARGHFLDEIEYFAAKNLGLDAAMSIQGVNVSYAPLPFHIEKQFTLLGWYEHLRLARYFDTQTVARVAVPGDEFRLRQNRDGQWQFTPVRMTAHRISCLGNGSEQWVFRNPYAEQIPCVRIEALYAVASYDSAKRIPLVGAADFPSLKTASASSDVSLNLVEEVADAKGGSRNVRLCALNKGSSRIGAWARASLEFPAPYRNLGGAGAFGVWVKGDGKGAVLNLQLGTPREFMHALSDHYITLDFTGWRYVELLVRERDVERMSDYVWPYGGAYDIYRNALDMSHISQVALYLNDLPPGERVEVAVSQIMALPVQPAALKRPSLSLNGQTVVLPLTLKSGDFAELEADGYCTHYSDKGDLIARVRPFLAGAPSSGVAPASTVLREGENAVIFDCEKPLGGVSARAEVTLSTFGAPFGTPRPSRQIGREHLKREYEMPRLITEPVGTDDDGWDVAVRPGEKADLEVELCGAMGSPVLTVCGRALRFPVTLKEGQRLICRDQRRWAVIDSARVKIAEGKLSEKVPVLTPGLNRVSFTCLAPVRCQVKLVKVYAR